ncbi:MAG TPA: type I-U CRISPR-associated protein Csx17, partial [Candidatus Bathyarchaeia archaeon]
MNSISITGCRHDIFGHQLKAIGLLRALATCADPKYRDPEAEGWWDLERACFHLRSYKYPNEEQLMEFFSQHYQPTAIFSPWNTGGGFDEQREVLITFSKIETNKKGISKPCKPTKHDTNRLITFLWRNRGILKSSGLKVRDKVKALRAEIPTTGEFSFVLKAIGEPTVAKPIDGITIRVRVKTSSKKDVIAILERDHHDRPDIVQGIKISRRFFDAFRRANSSDDMLLTFESLREQLPEQSSTAMDAILTTRTSRASDNPLFLNRGKGEGGNDELFRTFWNYFLAFRKHPFDYAVQCLFGRGTLVQLSKKQKEGIGTPFFPDAIKTYNHGLSWVVGTFSFNALDYLLAVEGAMVMRGAVSRALASNSRRFAAFPFIFDNGEDLTDGKQVVGTASSLWLPLWTRPVTFAELASFICDAQARLPGKEAWFSSEFARALRVQGVDAGFVGWQEFRFKMKASRVPWVCTGQYLGPTADRRPLQLNDALGPLDESRFLSQFEPRRKGNKIDSRSPHRVGAAINSAIEDTVAAPT